MLCLANIDGVMAIGLGEEIGSLQN